MTYAETAVNQTINRLLGEHPGLDASADGALDNLDQFHIGGADAVDLLIPTLALARTDVLLDIGSGFGGPARQIARRTGNRVIGIDITPAYVDAARDLTQKAMLRDLVEFEACDIATFQTEPQFQAAITMHVQMNVQDKVSWFEQIGRRLAPGARLAIWEVCNPGRHELAWPMPWSLDGTDSYIVDDESLTHRGRAGRIQHHRMDAAVRLGPGLDLQDHGRWAAHRAGIADASRRRLHPHHQLRRGTHQRCPRRLARLLLQEPGNVTRPACAAAM